MDDDLTPEQPETAELQHELDRLGDDIEGAREDWAGKQHDSAVPGAVEPVAQFDEGPDPEAEYTDKGSSEDVSGDDADPDVTDGDPRADEYDA